MPGPCGPAGDHTGIAPTKLETALRGCVCVGEGLAPFRAVPRHGVAPLRPTARLGGFPSPKVGGGVARSATVGAVLDTHSTPNLIKSIVC
jgi:hypothetical protein